mmetsp:Transcript_65924/g.143919  ORF Transcript_65924/g.143919 Transcript_65924/m.143919 type:complete len:126 (-) Transcript_65924:301-678(-)
MPRGCRRSIRTTTHAPPPPHCSAQQHRRPARSSVEAKTNHTSRSASPRYSRADGGPGHLVSELPTECIGHMRRAADLVLREEGLERGGVDVAGTVGVESELLAVNPPGDEKDVDAGVLSARDVML